ncbi:MAG: hypothetical protein AB203_00830 [Parcubacteria bacterium C7867-008]|nr:MAG: hypothetical protein AB203_00830 [Parcubacteria bacterium C7867-008]
MKPDAFLKTYFWPTKVRVLVFMVLSIYVTLSTMFLAPFMNDEQPERPLTVLEQVGMVATYPSMIFSKPFIYISGNLFTQQVTLSDLMQQPGSTALPLTPNATIESSTITQASPFGFALGAILESLSLYILACLICLPVKKKKTV